MPFEIKRIDPVAIFPGWRYLHRSWSGPGCGLFTGGLAPSDGYPAANVVWAGFDNWDNGGTWCHESIDYVFRGGVQFKLEGLPIFAKLVTAVLECWHQEPHDDADTFVTLSNFDWAHGILDRGLVPTAGPDSADFVDIIPPFATPADGLSGLVRIDVTDKVLLWLHGRPNFGFCFLGTDESMPNHDNSKAVNQFGSFKLELLFDIPARELADIPAVKQRTPRPFERVDQSIIGGALPAGFAQRLQQPVPRRNEGGQN